MASATSVRLPISSSTSFEEHAAPRQRAAVKRFAATQQSWLDDFALFMALKGAHDGAPWPQWPPNIAARQPAALARQRQRLEREIRRHIFVQYLFFHQWTALSLVDVLRLDHFRGFAGYWAIPGDAPTAQTGTWEPGPGANFFTALQDALGPLPLIAEDLGVITPDVVALREHFGFPGMKVLQFAFDGDATSPHLPHNYSPHCVVYTGTHDNDTAAGWFATAPPTVRAHALAYMASDGATPAWDLIRLASASVAETAIVPLQDLLGLGSEAPMNRPGQSGGNWRWRYTIDMLTEELTGRARTLARLYGRATSHPTGPAFDNHRNRFVR